MEFAFIDGREGNAVESFGVESKLGGDGGLFAVGIGGQGVGIVGDVGLVDPVGTLLLIGKIGELGHGIVNEFLRLLDRGLRSGRAGVRGLLWRSLLGAGMTLCR